MSLLSLSLLLGPPAAFGQTTPTADNGLKYRPVILAVTINGLAGDLGTVFFEDEGGRLFAPASGLKTMNLRASDLRTIGPDETVIYDLARIHGLTYSRDHGREELSISATPEAFLPTRINIGAATGQAVAAYSPGGYVNYDLSAVHASGVNTGQGLFDLGLFRGVGLLTSSFTAGTAPSARLMTTFEADRGDAIKTLRIGDSFNTTGAWGRGVLFGGIQYGTNFAIRPDFISQSMPSVSGKALLPSTVDVYVNNVLRSRQSVNAGPFTIQNLPAISGAGDMRIVVKDMLGRQQLITQPFFTSPNLLRAGLVDDAYELGWLRQNYGLKSNDYTDPFATATYRRGVSEQITGEARVELQRDVYAGGLSVAATLPGLSSVVESSVAVSAASRLSTGTMASLSYSYLGRSWAANARTQVNSPSFRQLGSNPANLTRRIDAFQVSVPVGDGTLSANYLRNLSQGASPSQGKSQTSLVNLNYAKPIAEGIFGSFMMIKSLSGRAETTLWLTLTVMFDQNHFGSTTLTREAGAPSLYTQFQQSEPRDSGTGYRVAALNAGNNSRQEASVTRNQSFGRAEADFVRQNDVVSSRLGARGGINLLGGGVYFSRGLDGGFAVVRTNDVPDIPIYLENQIVAHTDQSGRALVSNVRPYEDNHISIDPLSLPMEASVNEIEKIVMPRRRGGVLVDFDVHTVRSATLTILRTNGTPLPPWTKVEVVGTEGVFVTGNRGEVSVSLPNLKGNRVIARLADGPACELTVDLPEPVPIAPFIGPLTCDKSR